ncbi:hypothetical protein D3C87_1748760 [compost metagenome]
MQLLEADDHRHVADRAGRDLTARLLREMDLLQLTRDFFGGRRLHHRSSDQPRRISRLSAVDVRLGPLLVDELSWSVHSGNNSTAKARITSAAQGLLLPDGGAKSTRCTGSPSEAALR